MEQTLNRDIIVTMEHIVGSFANFSQAKKVKDVKAAVLLQLAPDGDNLFSDCQRSVCDQVEKLIREDKKLGDESRLVYSNGKYKKRKRKALPQSQPVVDNLYSGKAGELAVLSELLFHGYNANQMMVDDGIDIIASKNNVFFYVQVKTVAMSDNSTIHCSIPLERFSFHLESQIRYIVVTRIQGKKGTENLFFIFTTKDLRRLIKEGAVKEGQSNISIKIRYDVLSGSPILYDSKEADATFYMNNFDLA